MCVLEIYDGFAGFLGDPGHADCVGFVAAFVVCFLFFVYLLYALFNFVHEGSIFFSEHADTADNLSS